MKNSLCSSTFSFYFEPETESSYPSKGKDHIITLHGSQCLVYIERRSRLEEAIPSTGSRFDSRRRYHIQPPTLLSRIASILKPIVVAVYHQVHLTSHPLADEPSIEQTHCVADITLV